MSLIVKNKTEESIDVMILDTTYTIKCSAQESSNIKHAANYLDAKMREFHSKVSKTTEKNVVIIMSALNVVYEIMYGKNKKESQTYVASNKVKDLLAKIDEVLDDDF